MECVSTERFVLTAIVNEDGTGRMFHKPYLCSTQNYLMRERADFHAIVIGFWRRTKEADEHDSQKSLHPSHIQNIKRRKEENNMTFVLTRCLSMTPLALSLNV
jgi:hypothetical protein